jgi:hypothetical protein
MLAAVRENSAIAESLMDNFAIAMDGVFKKALQQTPASPTRLPHQLHPRTPRLQNCCTAYARAKLDIGPGTTRDLLAISLLRPTHQNIAGRPQPHRLLHQCGQVMDVQFFLKLRAYVLHCLVTDM